jgi:hypothetical protein
MTILGPFSFPVYGVVYWSSVMPPRVDAAGAGWGGAIGAGTGFGARFLAFALLAGFAFFIPFFLRAGAPRFAFLDFFATFNLPNRINQIMQHGIMP